MSDSAAEVQARIAEMSIGAWGLAALGAAAQSGLVRALGEPRSVGALADATGVPEPLAERLLDVLHAFDLVERTNGHYVARPGLSALSHDGPLDALRADLSSTLLQTSDLLSTALRGELSEDGWSHTDPLLLQAQGKMSAGAVDFLEYVVFPSVPGIPERLTSESAAFLDVGAGVGAVSIELCRRYQHMNAVGLEPLEAPLELARRNVERAGLGGRVELRQQLVQDLTDDGAFDVAWLPGNFLPTADFPAALDAVFRALRPGGLVLMATLGGGGDDPAAATARLCATLWGGDAVEPDAVVETLGTAGFVDVHVLDRLPSRLQPIQARRP